MTFAGLISRSLERPGWRNARLSLAVASTLLLPVSANAEPARPAGVVELFTSQGCSSCPPADSVFADLVAKGDVVALAYHVDYWDYLGWRDTFATADNTARQYEYMKSFGAQSVYTPQAVINGRKHVNGADESAVNKALGELQRTHSGLIVDVKARRKDSSLMIWADAVEGGPNEAEVVLVYFDPPTPVEISRGENNGKTVTYWNAVTGVQVAGMWHGKSTNFELPMREVTKKGAGGCAVLLQAVGRDGLPGPILGATVIKDPAS